MKLSTPRRVGQSPPYTVVRSDSFIRATVTDSNGAPIQGVEITVKAEDRFDNNKYSWRGTTGDSGIVEIPIDRSVMEPVDVRAEIPGEPQEKTANVGGSVTFKTSFAIPFSPAGSGQAGARLFTPFFGIGPDGTPFVIGPNGIPTSIAPGSEKSDTGTLTTLAIVAALGVGAWAIFS